MAYGTLQTPSIANPELHCNQMQIAVVVNHSRTSGLKSVDLKLLNLPVANDMFVHANSVHRTGSHLTSFNYV